MFMMIKCRPRLVRDSAMCRQSEVLSQISRPSEGRPSGVFPYQWYLDFWHQMILKNFPLFQSYFKDFWSELV